MKEFTLASINKHAAGRKTEGLARHNPAYTEKQRKLFGVARGIQKGETPASYSPQAAKIAKTVSPKKVKEFAKSVRKKGGR